MGVTASTHVVAAPGRRLRHRRIGARRARCPRVQLRHQQAPRRFRQFGSGRYSLVQPGSRQAAGAECSVGVCELVIDREGATRVFAEERCFVVRIKCRLEGPDALEELGSCERQLDSGGCECRIDRCQSNRMGSGERQLLDRPAAKRGNGVAMHTDSTGWREPSADGLANQLVRERDVRSGGNETRELAGFECFECLVLGAAGNRSEFADCGCRAVRGRRGRQCSVAGRQRTSSMLDA